ncbi:hypothetical protein C8J56DRAFT_1061147 [Mycena floridula]|nr:hypothetical protein C8J56DRAFT_1061147 [Mycena floridula]
MTIKGLLGDSEYNLTNLLKHLIKHDPTGNRCVKGTPDIIKAFIHQVFLLRTYYIVATLGGILEAYHGRPPVAIQVARFSGQEYKGEERQKARDKLKNSNIQIDQSQCKEEAKAAVNESMQSLQIGQVLLCRMSNENWKEHKKVCTQQGFDPELLSPSPQAPDQFISCPDPVPGFICTPALWRQIWYLSKADSQNWDYHIVEYGCTRSIAILNPLNRSWFHVARRRAMVSGDISAVHMMLHIIEAQDNDHHYGLGVDKIHHQFELKYNISFSADKLVNNVCEMATGEEVFEEMQFLRKRLVTVNIEDRYTAHCLTLGSDFVPRWNSSAAQKLFKL